MSNLNTGLPPGDGFCWVDFTVKLSIALSCSYNAYQDNALACLHRNDLYSDFNTAKCLHQHHSYSVRYSEFESFKEPIFYYDESKIHHVAGYVTVAKDHRLIIVTFRGTSGRHQLWMQIWNTRFYRKPFRGGGLVMDYVVQAYNALEPQVEKALFRLTKKYPGYELLFCGHSLGGSIAQIAASRIANEQLFFNVKILLLTFGMPRIGTKEHADAVNQLVPCYIRFAKKFDVVPLIPPWLYHAGYEIVVEQSFWEFQLDFLWAHREYLGYSTYYTPSSR